jgi:hypothetical protein
MKKLVFVICMLSMSSLCWAQSAPSLGSATSFAVLGSAAVTCAATSTITGDLGVWPGSSITGFPAPCSVVSGTIHTTDATAQAAHHDAALAYGFLAGETCTTDLTGLDLGTADVSTLGTPLLSGVYCFSSSAGLTGTLYLGGAGPWIFKIGSSLTTAGSVLVNGHPFDIDACTPGVFWQVGSTATLGSGSQIQGVIIALASDTLTSANVSGGLFALTGAVTLSTDLVNACNEGSGGTTPPAAGKIKVTGGGQIQVPGPADTGTAAFGFNAGTGSGGLGGHFDYVNHFTGLHVNGPVTDIVVIAFNPDGSPKTVLFSGTCGGSCAFSGTVEDHAEPGVNDLFGVTVTGVPLSEITSPRVISKGNIQFHPTQP